MMRFFRSLFSLPPDHPSDAEYQQQEKSRVRAIVARLSTGNLRLRMGLFTTQAEHDVLKAQVLAHNFEVPHIPLETLKKSEPRTDAQIRQAFADGRFAEMSPHAAGESCTKAGKPVICSPFPGMYDPVTEQDRLKFDAFFEWYEKTYRK